MIWGAQPNFSETTIKITRAPQLETAPSNPSGPSGPDLRLPQPQCEVLRHGTTLPAPQAPQLRTQGAEQGEEGPAAVPELPRENPKSGNS